MLNCYNLDKYWRNIFQQNLLKNLREEIPGRQNKMKSGTNVSMYTADYTNSLLPSKLFG